MVEWSLVTFILSFLIVLSGSLLQAATGMGAGFVVVPLLALIHIDLVPGPPVFASMLLTSSMAIVGRKHIDYHNVGVLVFGMLLGVVVGGLVIAQMPTDQLGIAFGLLILVAVIISIFVPEFKLTRKRMLATGSLAGFVGVVAGIGGPIIGLMYQHKKGPVIRATLAFLFFIASVMMLTSLHFAGRFSLSEIISGLYLMPGFVLGFILSPRLAKAVDAGMARPILLNISTLSALALIFKSLF